MRTLGLRKVDWSKYRITLRVLCNCLCNLFVNIVLSLFAKSDATCMIFTSLFVVAIIVPAAFGAYLLDKENAESMNVFRAVSISTYRRKYKIFQLSFAAVATILLSIYLAVFEVFTKYVNFLGGLFIAATIYAVIVIGSSLIFAVNTAAY